MKGSLNAKVAVSLSNDRCLFIFRGQAADFWNCLRFPHTRPVSLKIPVICCSKSVGVTLVAHGKRDLHFFAVIQRPPINNACLSLSHCVAYSWSDWRVYTVVCSNIVPRVTKFLLACLNIDRSRLVKICNRVSQNSRTGNSRIFFSVRNFQPPVNWTQIRDLSCFEESFPPARFPPFNRVLSVSYREGNRLEET